MMEGCRSCRVTQLGPVLIPAGNLNLDFHLRVLIHIALAVLPATASGHFSTKSGSSDAPIHPRPWFRSRILQASCPNTAAAAEEFLSERFKHNIPPVIPVPLF